MSDYNRFVPQFIEETKGMDSEQLAEAVWKFANAQWKAGFNQGKYDPGFENDGVDDDE